MRTLTTLLLTLTLLTAQSQAVLDLGTGSQVRNSIIFQNPATVQSVSGGAQVTFSASDAVLPSASNNLLLLTSPFISPGTFEINTSSQVYQQGNLTYLDARDTLDLGFNPRVSCDEVDMGAYEAVAIRTEITLHPTPLERLDTTICEGESLFLQVEAAGTNLTFQWQRNGINMVGQTGPTLNIINLTAEHAGDFRVIAIGDCCNDTSNVVRLYIHQMPAVVAMDDRIVPSGTNIQLYTISYLGDGVSWYRYDMATPVAYPFTIANITETTQFFAAVSHGVCPEPAIAQVQIIVEGYLCLVRTFPDTTVCAGAPFRLLIYQETTVFARWFEVGSDIELPNASVIRPDTIRRFVLIGFDENNGACAWDTLTLRVPDIDFTVRAAGTYCIGIPLVPLYSVPPADAWFGPTGIQIGVGNIDIVPLAGQRTVYTAQFTDPITGCVIFREVAITINPPDLTIPFATFYQGRYYFSICEGSELYLYTAIDPIFVYWERLSTGEIIPDHNTIVGEIDDIFRAHAWDNECGDVYIDLVLTVLPLPSLEILPQAPVPSGTAISLVSSPNATLWTDADGTRVFMPVTVTETQYFYAIFEDGDCRVIERILVEVFDVGDLDLYIYTDDGCFTGDGSAYVDVGSGTPPFTFEWSHSATTALIENLQPGTFTVTVTDADGLTGTASATILAVATPAIEVQFTITPASNRSCDNASVSTTVTGGEPPHYFEWRRLGYDGIVSVGPHLSNVAAGAYSLTIIDQRGCEIHRQILVGCDHERPVPIPSILVTPDGDGRNDYLFIENIEDFPINTVTIINSYGAEIIRIQNYCNEDPARRWGGRNSRGQYVPDGTYWFVVQVEGLPPMIGWALVRFSPGR